MISKEETIKEYYQALVDKNPEYLNKYYVGVKTTGIFCISTCYARKPLKKNVSFYTHKEDVIAAGFRSCKKCKAGEHQSLK